MVFKQSIYACLEWVYLAYRLLTDPLCEVNCYMMFNNGS